jgi:hypothetical protein
VGFFVVTVVNQAPEKIRDAKLGEIKRLTKLLEKPEQ